jgi:hypothetical protein
MLCHTYLSLVLLGTPFGNTLGTSWGTHIEHENIIGNMMGTPELIKFIVAPLVLPSDLIFVVFYVVRKVKT